MNKPRNKTWESLGNEYVQCPVEGCNHIGKIITKAHCKTQHGASREELEGAYGLPYRVLPAKGKSVYFQK